MKGRGKGEAECGRGRGEGGRGGRMGGGDTLITPNVPLIKFILSIIVMS